MAAAYNGLAKTNVFGLTWALGAETAGALRFTGDGSPTPTNADPILREIPMRELDQRIVERQ